MELPGRYANLSMTQTGDVRSRSALTASTRKNATACRKRRLAAVGVAAATASHLLIKQATSANAKFVQTLTGQHTMQGSTAISKTSACRSHAKGRTTASTTSNFQDVLRNIEDFEFY